jgi:hypothetical protein
MMGNVVNSDLGNGVKTATFDGTGGSGTSYFVKNQNFALGSTFTIECFAYVQNDGDFVVQTTGGIQFYTNGGSVWYSQVGVVNIFSASVSYYNAWHHFALVKNGSNVKVFFDGTAIINGTDNTDFGSRILYVGATPQYSQYMGGKMAGLRITNTAVYTSNFTTPTTLPTNITGTQMLLNFRATAAPTV